MNRREGSDQMLQEAFDMSCRDIRYEDHIYRHTSHSDTDSYDDHNNTPVKGAVWCLHRTTCLTQESLELHRC